MAQTLEYNKNVTAVVPVTIPTFDDDLKIIQALDDEPNDVGGMTAAELKAKFDEGNITAQQYINDVLIPAVVADDMTEQSRQAAESERVANEIERVSNEEARVTAEADREKEIAKVENLTVSSEALEYGEPASAEVTTNPETGGLNVHFGLPMGKDGLSFLPVIEGDDVPDGVEAWIDPSIESYQGEGSTVGNGVVISPDEPTDPDATVWIDEDDEEGEFYNKAETDVLLNGKVSMELLWENASPTSTFNAQTLNIDISKYDIIRITAHYDDHLTVQPCVDIPIHLRSTATGALCALGVYSASHGYVISVRTFDVSKANNTITFKNTYQTQAGVYGEGNNRVLPYAIYGIKGVQ